MEERMCQQQISTSDQSQTNYAHQHSHENTSHCHRCKMCSLTLSASSSSASSSSSSLSIISSPVLCTDLQDNRYHKKHLSRQSYNRKSSSSCYIQQHLQSLFGLLRREETLKMAVRLESSYFDRTRYLVVVSRIGRNQSEECCLLGIDCNKQTSVGLVLKILADTSITLDGDGGFSVSVYGRQHIFKPVSVQAMWSALQTLYKVSTKAREYNYFEGGNTHEWVAYYEQNIDSDRSCLNEWHTMNDIESRRPPSPDSLRSKPKKRLETERVIRSTLKEIMMSVDLDEVTSKYIRSRLEEQLDMDLREFKSFIDEEMLVILGQMDAATEIFPHVYLGSEWNASNIEELNKNSICYILNITREIDNFFPGTFNYLNIRVYDDDNTDLLKHWDNTYKYINKVKKEGSKVLVHCKMGISRSASVVIAYAMKAYNWDFKKSFEYVRKKRSCIKPNQNFINQLETYQGMLDAMKNKEKLQRSKSETNLKSSFTKNHFHVYSKNKREQHDIVANGQVDDNEKSNHLSETDYTMLRVYSGTELARFSMRPKSWSPDNLIVSEMFSSTGTMSQSLEHLNTGKLSGHSYSSSASSLSTSPPCIPPAPPLPPLDSRYNLNMRMPCENGLTYSVSQNKIVQLYCAQNQDTYNMGEKETTSFSSNKRYKFESYYQDTEINQASTDSHNFALQIPSQFQDNPVLFSKKDTSNNLVIKDVDSGNEEIQKSQYFVSKDQFLYPNNLDKVLLDKKNNERNSFNKETDSFELTSHQNYLNSHTSNSALCYQDECQNSLPKRYDEKKCLLPLDNYLHVPHYTSGKLTPSETIQKKDCNSSNVANNNERLMKTNTLLASNVECVSDKNLFIIENTSPNVINTVQCSSVKHRTTLLERLTNSRSGRTKLPTEKDDEANKGIVLNLKKEFEAKCNIFDRNKQHKKCSVQNDNNNNDNDGGNHNENTKNNIVCGVLRSTASIEDLSVRKLVGKYEVVKSGKDRSKYDKRQPPIPPRKSSLDIKLTQTRTVTKHVPTTAFSQYNRGHRSVAPIVKSFLNTPNEIKTTVAKAANMLQQSKTHPLSKLTFCKQRNSNPPPPVYNTM